MFTQTFARLVIFALGAGALLSTAKVDPKQAKTPKIEPGSHSLTPPPQAKTPFAFQRLDHIVVRAKDHQKMLDFYVGVLGAEADWIGRFDGSLSHIRIGNSLIDLQSYDAPAGRPLHAGGLGLAADAPVPPMDPALGTLDHFAINMAPRGARVFSEISGASRRRRGDDADVPRSRDDDERRYDPEAVTAYLTEAGYPPFMQTGHRYGSDGNGYSIYLQDPEQNVIELKSGDSCDSQ